MFRTVVVLLVISNKHRRMVLSGRFKSQQQHSEETTLALWWQRLPSYASIFYCTPYRLLMTMLDHFQIPLLEYTSPSAAILLVSSLAAIVPAPTRTLYGSTKGASLLLYQSLSIEHPRVKFSAVIPSTIEGDFRASAVDGGKVREANPNKHGLKKSYVAQRCIQAVDEGQKVVLLPHWFSKVAHLMYWAYPPVVERFASKKYNFTAS